MFSGLGAKRDTIAISIGLFFVCAVIFIVYLPGLGATFLLDDYATLPYLTEWGHIANLTELKHFILNGFTGPTGRPVSLLSFAANASSWPDNPAPFLFVNIVLHLANVILLFLFLIVLFAELKVNHQTARYLALIAAAVWGAHPYHVSSVLYIIQRMVVLEAFFNLAAICLYLIARRTLLRGNLMLGGAALLGSGVLAVLALLSKENAVLIPLQLWLIEALLLNSGAQDSPATRWVRRVAIILPSLVVLIYLANRLGKNLLYLLEHGRELPSRREFSMFERLMTEARILGDYLQNIIIPKGQTAGVFHDGYVISASIWSPISTIVWMLVHGCFAGLAVVFRKRFQIFCFGVLWFYVNHILESSVVMLELKFEHRNYIPSLGIILAISWFIINWVNSKRYKVFGGLILFSMCLAFLFFRVSLWGQPEKAVGVWVQENPRSSRALESAAVIYSKAPDGHIMALKMLERSYKLQNANPLVGLKYYAYACRLGAEVDDVDLAEIEKELVRSRLDWQAIPVLELLLESFGSEACEQITIARFRGLVNAVSNNRKYKRTRVPMYAEDLMARVELLHGEPQVAKSLYVDSNYTKPLKLVMSQALLLASHGQLDGAAYILHKGIQDAKEADRFVIEQAEEMLSKIVKDL
ncbi:hypothetical protein SAMN02745866_00226 [Alteromonadaceae bacterium Bs31]|nr:hypothetical protein SAMN02745866_00226 [Alteromonadaceae bacterium Bs31]